MSDDGNIRHIESEYQRLAKLLDQEHNEFKTVLEWWRVISIEREKRLNKEMAQKASASTVMKCDWCDEPIDPSQDAFWGFNGPGDPFAPDEHSSQIHDKCLEVLENAMANLREALGFSTKRLPP